MKFPLSFRFLVAVPFLTTSLLSFSEEAVGDWVENDADWKKLQNEEVVILDAQTGKGGKDALQAATAAILIDAPISKVWNVVNDKEGAADYMDDLISAKIVKEEETFALVEQKLKVGLTKVTYIVKHQPTHEDIVNFSLHSGDLKEMKGFWKFVSVEDGDKTLLVYNLALKPGFPLPQFVIKNSLEKNLPEALEAVKGEVARRG